MASAKQLWTAYKTDVKSVRDRALAQAKEQARYFGVSVTDVLNDPEAMGAIMAAIAAEGATGGAATPVAGTALAVAGVRYAGRRRARMQAKGFRGNGARGNPKPRKTTTRRRNTGFTFPVTYHSRFLRPNDTILWKFRLKVVILMDGTTTTIMTGSGATGGPVRAAGRGASWQEVSFAGVSAYMDRMLTESQGDKDFQHWTARPVSADGDGAVWEVQIPDYSGDAARARTQKGGKTVKRRKSSLRRNTPRRNHHLKTGEWCVVKGTEGYIYPKHPQVGQVMATKSPDWYRVHFIGREKVSGWVDGRKLAKVTPREAAALISSRTKYSDKGYAEPSYRTAYKKHPSRSHEQSYIDRWQFDEVGAGRKNGARKNPLVAGYSPKSVSANIRREMHAGKSQAQAVAIALSVARKAYRKRHPGTNLPKRLRAK